MSGIKRVLQEKVVGHMKGAVAPSYVDGAVVSGEVHKDIFAVDIGFGYTKFKSTDAEGAIASLCNSIGSLYELQVDEVQNENIINSLAIEHDGQVILVGKLASKYNPQVARSTYRERSLDDNFLPLYKAAIVSAFAGYSNVELTVVTGLPNDDLEQIADLRAIIESVDHVSYYNARTKHTICLKYEDIIIKTQPEGFRAEIIRDEELKDIEIKRMGVLDFGHGTLNVSLFDGEDLLAIGTKTFSTSGVHAMHDTMALALKGKFTQFEPTHLAVETALIKKEVKVRNHVYPIVEEVESIKRKYAHDSFKVIYEKWKAELDQLNIIFITGGGSHLIADEVAQIFEEKAKYDHVYGVGSSQFLTVRGYYRIGEDSVGEIVDESVEMGEQDGER